MKIEVRNDSVLISGYVNAVERYSKPIRESLGGKIRTFIEKIRAGVFGKALQRNDNVLVLLNHQPDRVLANTKDGSAKLEEDNIGLRAEITITDKEVVEKAREGKLSGWSFGFFANEDEIGKDGEDETRTVTDLDLVEVSILDDRCEPAYYGTSIEARKGGAKVMEIRADAFSKDEVVEEVQEAEETVTEELAEEEQTISIEELADMVAKKVIEALKGAEETKAVEETEEETEEETAEETEEPVEEEKAEDRAIDYSSFEERLARLNA